ncbi:MAG: PAS domain S-box protein [Proteobacteria bacterium]|nr:PAS domain S-box protein [Pseudomonadota bacterium]MBU1686568.1 PAS domain S-box protein [Pseudomonadota bacterium]
MTQTTLYSFLDSSEISKSPAVLVRARLKWVLFLRGIILTMLLGTSALIQTKSHALELPSYRIIAAFIIAVYIYTFFSVLLIKFLKNYNPFALFQIVSDALIATCIIYATGGSQSIFTIIYFFPILTGSFLLLRLGGLLMAATCTICYGFMLLVEILRPPWLIYPIPSPVNDIMVAMHFFAIHGLAFFMVAIFSIVIFERMKKTERALFQSTMDFDRLAVLYKQIFDDITTGIITVDPKGKISSMNRAVELICGFQANEVVGHALDDLFPDFNRPPLDAEQYMRQQTEFIRKDGEKIPIGFSWNHLNMPGEPGEYRVYTMQDLSQIRRMEKQVKQAEKMATIGEMAASIAHEFRNPMAAISGAAQVLSQDYSNESSNQKLLTILLRESDRLEATIDGFLEFSKPIEPTPEWFSLKQLIDETLQLLHQAKQWTPEKCRIIDETSPDLDCWADTRQLQQVLENLIGNSCQALGNQLGEVAIHGEEIKNEMDQEMTKIIVSDNGPGISHEILPQIFEPFFTTRENGTGLGLAIVKQIIDSHGGNISVESNPGHGTTFTIVLPLPLPLPPQT